MNLEDVTDWPTVAELQAEGVLLVEDGNHGEYRPRPDEFVDDGPALFIRAADMSDGRILFSEAKAINEVALDRIRKGVGCSGDVIFSHKGTVGKVALAPDDAPPFVCSPQTTFWRTLDESELDRRFLHAYLRSPFFVQQWYGRKGETDMADYVSLTAQRRLRIPVIPIEAQRQIGAAVSQFDDLIENNRRRIEILEEMARVLYREWFVNFRFPGHENVDMVESELGEIPEGWEIRTLADTCEHKKRNLTPHKFGGEKFLHYSIPALDADRLPSLEHGEEIRSGKYEMVEDCVLLSKLNPRFPRVWRSKGPYSHRAVCSTEFLVLESSPGGWSLDYLQCFVQNSDLGVRLAQMAGGTSTSHQRVKPGAVMALPIVAPSDDLVAAFSERLQPINELVLNLIDQNQALREARDLLLPRLVSGELDVSELDLDSVAGSVV